MEKKKNVVLYTKIKIETSNDISFLTDISPWKFFKEKKIIGI